MRTRVFASVVLFLLVTIVSAPWLQSEDDDGVPHFNASSAIAAWDTPACTVAFRAHTARSAALACESFITPTRCISRAKRLGRFVLELLRATGSRSICRRQPAL